MKKQTMSKKAGSPRKSEKRAAAKAPRTKERDPRLPAAGTTLTRTYKGKELKVAVLDEGFRFGGEEYRSLSALAMKVTGYAAINGVAWFGLTRRAGTPKTVSAKETETAVASTKTRAPKRTPNSRRAARDTQPAASTESAPEAAPAADTATA